MNLQSSIIGESTVLTTNARVMALDYLDKSWSSGELKPVLAEAYGVGNEREWYVNWRLFFLACAELFGLDNGEEWLVSLYLFERRG